MSRQRNIDREFVGRFGACALVSLNQVTATDRLVPHRVIKIQNMHLANLKPCQSTIHCGNMEYNNHLVMYT